MLDPRTPVIVGSGQVNHSGGDAPEPLDLLARACQRAAADTGSDRVLSKVTSVRVVRILSWDYGDPGRRVAELIGVNPQHTVLTTDGGHTPQALVGAAAADIAAGHVDAVLLAGAESWKTRMRYRSGGETPPWSQQDGSLAPDERFGQELTMLSAHERRAGIDRPVRAYPLIESAWRQRLGHGLDEHVAHISRLWAGFSVIASTNPFAAFDRGVGAEIIGTPASANRMIATPYTKLLCSNSAVDQSAALLLCSVDCARSLGIASDRWVFPWSAASAQERAPLSARPEIDSSPALREAGRAALELAGIGAQDVAHVDLYSCFPAAVQVAANELGLATDRPLTVTGGMTFAGGPWNNFATHSIATMVNILRADPAALALCSANGGVLTKHALGVYSATPPPLGFRSATVRSAHEAIEVIAGASVNASIDAYTVSFDKVGADPRVMAICSTPTGERTVVSTTRSDVVSAALTFDIAASQVRVHADGTFDVA